MSFRQYHGAISSSYYGITAITFVSLLAVNLVIAADIAVEAPPTNAHLDRRLYGGKNTNIALVK